MRISLLGEPYSFHHVAALQYWGMDDDMLFCDDFAQVIDAVLNGTSDMCIIAVENTVAGDVPGNYARVVESGLFIHGEINLHLAMHLAAKKEVTVDSLHTVISHPMALKETASYFVHYPKITLVPATSTSAAVKSVAESADPGVAAIGNTSAIRFYNLQIIVKNIDNHPNNITRFLILSKKSRNLDATAAMVKASLRVVSAPPAFPATIKLRRDLKDGSAYIEIAENHTDQVVEQVNRITGTMGEVVVMGIYPTGVTVSGS
jgi:prephenate dehydratase